MPLFFMKPFSKRATLHFDPKLLKAVQLKAAETETSVSAIVSQAIKNYLNEDTEDLSAFRVREKEPCVSLEQALKKLKSSGKI